MLPKPLRTSVGGDVIYCQNPEVLIGLGIQRPDTFVHKLHSVVIGNNNSCS